MKAGSVKDKEDYLLLSQLTQAGYCLRRCALIMTERLWQENADTAKGRFEHRRVHESRIERSKDIVKLFEQEVWSDRLEVRGKCDCIEAIRDETGIRIHAAEFPVRLLPVEYKHGSVRKEAEYEMQLCAQAMCLEEMYSAQIFEGAIFYTSSHRRVSVKFEPSLRSRVEELICRVSELQKSGEIPPAEYGPKCEKCSLREKCMPRVAHSAKKYCEKTKREAREMEKL